MRMDRKWITLALVTALVATGCSKKKPEVVPPPVDTRPTAPSTDVSDVARPDAIRDTVEEQPPESIQQMQDRLFSQGLLGDVFFSFDQYDLGQEARERLAKNAEFLNSNDGRSLTLTIEGHCDERGTNEYNLALGNNRSTTARDYLVSLGVSAARLRVVSFGEERPFCTESSEGCWQKNRRARFVISGNGN